MAHNSIAGTACSRRGFLAGAAGLVASVALPAMTARPASAGTPILGPAQHTASQLARWHASVGQRSQATVPVEALAQLFLDEGGLEGVRGDIAFCQTMVETAWLTFPTARMPARNNNFSGLGANDGGSGSSAFPDARTGVRAQIQHLKGWAAPITASQLRTPLVDPRWAYLRPTGQLSEWDQLGSGRWASDPRYGTTILAVYGRLLRHAGRPVLMSAAAAPVAARTATPAATAPAATAAAGPPFPGVVVKAGSTGAVVRQVQERLRQRRWSVPVNGTFDATTDRAVRRFQVEKGLPADGHVGPRTWTALWQASVT